MKIPLLVIALLVGGCYTAPKVEDPLEYQYTPSVFERPVVGRFPENALVYSGLYYPYVYTEYQILIYPRGITIPYCNYNYRSIPTFEYHRPSPNRPTRESREAREERVRKSWEQRREQRPTNKSNGSTVQNSSGSIIFQDVPHGPA